MTLSVSISIMLMFIFMALLGILNGEMKIRQIKYVISTFMFLIVIFAYLFEPSDLFSWDISRYYGMCDRMAARNGLYYAWVENEYRFFVIINLFFYFVAQIGNYALISAIPVAIDVIIFEYLLFDILSKNNESKKTINTYSAFFALFAWLSTVSVKMAVGSGRCTLAVSIFMLALYLEYINSREKIFSYFLYVASFLIHPISVLMAGVRLACNVKNKRYLLVASFSSILFLESLIYFLNNYLSFGYANMLGFKLNRYWGIFSIFTKSLHLSEISIYACWIMILAYMIYMVRVVSKNNEMKQNNSLYLSKIINFDKTLIVFAIAASLNFLFFQRIMYLLAFGLLFIVPAYLKCKHYKLVDLGMFFILFYVFFLNDLYGLIANYIGIYFLSR